jgi:hypothetical protein
VDAREAAMKLKKIFFWTAAIMVASLVVAFWAFYGRTFAITIPQAKIQESLDAKFPMSKTYLVVFTLEFSNPLVALEEGADRIRAGVDAEATFKIGGVTCKGTAVISGKLAYDRETGEFRLKDSKVEKLDIKGIPAQYTGKVDEIATVLAKQYLDKKPVYRLEQTDLKRSLARLLLKEVRVENGALVVTMGYGL